MRTGLRLGVVVAVALVTSAHVGSPDAWFEGSAGPYTITVHIQAPEVVPGIAVVNVKAPDSIERITAFVNTYDAEGGTPPPDELLPAADRPGWRRAPLWVMTAGSNRVTIDVHGGAGHGSVVVPLAAVAQRRLAASRGFLAAVFIGGAVLIAGMLTLVGAAVREGVLDPGLVPDEARRRRARWSVARAAVVIVLVLAGMTAWWRSEDRAFRERLYRPLDTAVRIDSSSGTPRLELTITDSIWLQRDEVELLRARGEAPISGLVDDHGKLMHLFLVADDGSAMAHLHPASADSVTFSSVLPPLAAGPYRVFADIVHASGFTQTLASRLTVPSLTSDSPVLSDPDDSWSWTRATGDRVQLDDGTTLTWLREPGVPLKAGAEAGLRFVIGRPEGDASPLEPYLGMPGHAAVVRDDGQVFIHLHPMGTISPAAQARLSSSPVHAAAHPATLIALADTLSFPYAFPKSGRYTVWVQLKRNGRILSGAFRADVE